MFKVSRFPDIKIIALVIAVTLFGIDRLVGEQLSSVLATPASFHHKRVSLVGILRGDSPVFELYENTGDALAMRAPKSLYVIAPENWRKSGPYDLRQVRVTGIVDANRHGIWGNPCSLLLEKIEILSGPVTPWPTTVAVFRNETGKPMVLHFGVPPTETEFMIQSKKYLQVITQEKQDPTVKAFSSKGSLITEAKIEARARAPYYDPINAASYYRITNNKIESVLPNMTKNWGWRR
jgi:hypothetical protein